MIWNGRIDGGSGPSRLGLKSSSGTSPRVFTDGFTVSHAEGWLIHPCPIPMTPLVLEQPAPPRHHRRWVLAKGMWAEMTDRGPGPAVGQRGLEPVTPGDLPQPHTEMARLRAMGPSSPEHKFPET